jgi:hypothetical protein
LLLLLLLLIVGEEEMTPGRGRWREHTTIAFSIPSFSSSLFSLSMRQMQAKTGVPNLVADSMACRN